MKTRLKHRLILLIWLSFTSSADGNTIITPAEEFQNKPRFLTSLLPSQNVSDQSNEDLLEPDQSRRLQPAGSGYCTNLMSMINLLNTSAFASQDSFDNKNS
jgi:hypothetical protein